MLEADEHKEILEKFAELGPLCDASILASDDLAPFEKWNVIDAIRGEITVGEKDVLLCVGIDHRFPLSLPKVFLCPWDALGFIPHVEMDGYVCYATSEGTLLNLDDPVGILLTATKTVVDTLKLGVSGDNEKDLVDDFSVYWQRLSKNFSDKPILPVFLSLSSSVEKITAYCDNEGYQLIAGGNHDVMAYFNDNRKVLNSLTNRNAIYIPFEKEEFVQPPRPDAPWSLTKIRELVNTHVSEKNLRCLKKVARKCRKREELVVLALPRPSGGTVLAGLLFHQVLGRHPLIGGGAKDPPEPIAMQRLDLEYLGPRGGIERNLGELNILLVGCGSVGGHIAVTLPQIGFRQLTLVDHDRMQPENIFRHVLGKNGVNNPKVDSLKAEILRRYPYMTIRTHQSRIEEVITDGTLQLEEFDLMIMATGDASVDLYLNRLCHNVLKKDYPNVVFTWLEPYGIGGHALLTRPGTAGCYRCLHSDPNSEGKLTANRAAFAAENQTFTKNDLGCGQEYTPYGALDAQRTAELAVRLATNVFSGLEPKNPLISWKGNDRDFKSAGFRTSDRYRLTTDHLRKTRYDYIVPECPVCGGVRQ